MFVLRRVRGRRASARSSWRGVRARRAMAGEPAPRRAGRALVRRNRRRYGGYIVHVGMARAVRRRRRVVGLPARARRAPRARADARRSAATQVTLRAPDRARRPSATAASSAIALGADLRRAQGRQARRRRCTPSAATTRRRRRSPRRPRARFFEGEATSEVGHEGRRRCATSGPRSSPTSRAALDKVIAGRQVFDRTATSRSPQQAQLPVSGAGLARVYAAQPPPGAVPRSSSRRW